MLIIVAQEQARDSVIMSKFTLTISDAKVWDSTSLLSEQREKPY